MTFPCCVKAKFVFTFTFSLFVLLQCPPPLTVTPTGQTLRNFSKEANLNPKKCKIELNSSNIFQMFLSRIGLFTQLGLLYLNLCNRVRYVAFNNYWVKKPIPESYQSVLSYSSVIMLGLFLSECKKEQIQLNIMFANLNFACVAYFVLKCRNIIGGAIYILLFVCIFSIAVTPATSILCILVFQIGCLLFTKNILTWLPIFLTILSNDIHVNPGPNEAGNWSLIFL